MNVPKNVLWFEVLLYLSLTLDALSAAFQDRTPSEELTESMIATGNAIVACLILLLVYFVWLAAQKRKNWPRWALSVALALSGDGVDDLRHALSQMVPPGPFHYPEDQMSDAPMRHLAAEITREKIFRQLHQELPYQSTVETDSWTERKDKSVRIEQTIFVERESQRKIVLGKGGATIKSIGADSRKEIAEIVGVPVHLFLFVKVRENWGDDPNRYREMGLEFPKE